MRRARMELFLQVDSWTHPKLYAQESKATGGPRTCKDEHAGHYTLKKRQGNNRSRKGSSELIPMNVQNTANIQELAWMMSGSQPGQLQEKLSHRKFLMFPKSVGSVPIRPS